ncbi:hypothetical protein JL2886_00550 [Phaeobacter gallaeciensis]|uniref:Uncharacterized protein n=1 Tax=Phaeobacter gallaeciensis TaxID=60890 RepID=A0A1B0ZMZ7_9RHOB|nr:hypothetical protein JL2886_00550 [Phaeobacter gallaeciensis]
MLQLAATSIPHKKSPRFSRSEAHGSDYGQPLPAHALGSYNDD